MDTDMRGILRSGVATLICVDCEDVAAFEEWLIRHDCKVFIVDISHQTDATQMFLSIAAALPCDPSYVALHDDINLAAFADSLGGGLYDEGKIALIVGGAETLVERFSNTVFDLYSVLLLEEEGRRDRETRRTILRTQAQGFMTFLIGKGPNFMPLSELFPPNENLFQTVIKPLECSPATKNKKDSVPAPVKDWAKPRTSGYRSFRYILLRAIYENATEVVVEQGDYINLTLAVMKSTDKESVARFAMTVDEILFYMIFYLKNLPEGKIHLNVDEMIEDYESEMPPLKGYKPWRILRPHLEKKLYWHRDISVKSCFMSIKLDLENRRAKITFEPVETTPENLD